MQSIDISTMAYDEWLKFIFDHPFEPEIEERWFADPPLIMTNPAIVVEHFTKMCKDFKEVGHQYSMEQLNQALWLLIGPHGLDPRLTECLFKRNAPIYGFREFKRIEPLPLTPILFCIRSMYYVYADYIAPLEEAEIETIFDMWWDMLCGDFWNEVKYARRKEGGNLAPARLDNFEGDDDEDEVKIPYSELNKEEKEILDCMFETLCKILKLDDQCCQLFALHGLGHCRHPQAPAVVQDFIDKTRNQWDPESIEWLEECRDGTVL